MWSALTTDFFAYVDRGGAYLRAGTGAWPVRAMQDRGRIDRTQLPEALMQGGTNSRRSRLHVLLGSSLCRFLLLENTHRLRNDAEVLALAAGVLKERLGLDPGEWTCAVDRGWNSTALVCAVRSTLLRELREAATGGRCKLMSVRPWIGSVLRSTGQQSKVRALGLIESDSASLLSEHAGATQVQMLLLGDGNDPVEALRYLTASAGIDTRSVRVLRFDPTRQTRDAQPMRSDFADCAISEASRS